MVKCRNVFMIFVGLLITSIVFGQNFEKNGSENDKYVRLIPSKGESKFHLELNSDFDPAWSKWSIRSYNFGFEPEKTPMFISANGIFSTPYMIQVRGNEVEKNRKRWGFHLFEGYANDDKSRVTMLVNKHIEFGKPVAEMYYYGTEYDHSEEAYNWFRIGSDVRDHSFMFSRDKAVFFGSLKLSNVFTLGNIGKDNIRKDKPDGDDEKNYVESAKYVNYKELRESGDGTIFYDYDNEIVVIKIGGEWMKLKVEKLPDYVRYDF